jgi:hypothetical protein
VKPAEQRLQHGLLVLHAILVQIAVWSAGVATTSIARPSNADGLASSAATVTVWYCGARGWQALKHGAAMHVTAAHCSFAPHSLSLAQPPSASTAETWKP